MIYGFHYQCSWCIDRLRDILIERQMSTYLYKNAIHQVMLFTLYVELQQQRIKPQKALECTL